MTFPRSLIASRFPVQYSLTMSCPGAAATPMGPVTLAKTLEEAGAGPKEDPVDLKLEAIKIAELSINALPRVIWSPKASAELFFWVFISVTEALFVSITIGIAG